MEKNIIPVEIIEDKIYFIRGQRIMIDEDLAKLYRVETKVLNQSVKRNIDRFPSNFMFQLTDDETLTLRSQIVTSNESKGGRRYNPYAFTEYGVVMLSSILNSKRAIAINIQVIDTFVKLRKMIEAGQEISKRMDELEFKFMLNAKETNEQIEDILATLKLLLAPKEDDKKQIGFIIDT